eukprot:6977555-Pyramimonas_sp.AAC.1
MTEFFESCVTLYAELTDTDPATYPAAGTSFGPELIDLEDCQGGPRCEIYPPAEEAIAPRYKSKLTWGLLIGKSKSLALMPQRPAPMIQSHRHSR